MMQKVIRLALLICLMALPTFAQKAELFGGYQFTHLEPSLNANGWNAALTGNFNSFLGFTADFSGVYKSGFKFHTYTFGPEVHAHLPGAKPFVHALFGGGTASGGGTSTTGFTMYLGGGLDVKIAPAVSARLVQADWMITRFEGVTDKKEGRVSAGLVLRF